MIQAGILRQQAKTREQRFLNLMEQEFNYPPKIAQAILTEAQDCLLSQPAKLQPCQMRVILLKRTAPHGRALRHTVTQEVTLTAFTETTMFTQQFIAPMKLLLLSKFSARTVLLHLNTIPQGTVKGTDTDFRPLF